jgi:hypothetical protein
MFPPSNFGGTIDGNGKKITGLTISSTTSPFGMFISTTSASFIMNLEISNSIINCPDNNCGVFVGSNDGILLNCTSSNNTLSTTSNGLTKNNLGGLVGNAEINSNITEYTSTQNVINANSARLIGSMNQGKKKIAIQKKKKFTFHLISIIDGYILYINKQI